MHYILGLSVNRDARWIEPADYSNHWFTDSISNNLKGIAELRLTEIVTIKRDLRVWFKSDHTTVELGDAGWPIITFHEGCRAPMLASRHDAYVHQLNRLVSRNDIGCFLDPDFVEEIYCLLDCFSERFGPYFAIDGEPYSYGDFIRRVVCGVPYYFAGAIFYDI